MYLTAPSVHSVYSFPLTNGIPSRTPNAIITGLSYPEGIAVDDAGYVYVSDVGTREIDAFAPGSNGPAKPVRRIPVRVDFMTLWDDYLITQGDRAIIDVFPTGGNGPTPPVEEIYFGSSDLGLATRPDGRLYLSWNGPGNDLTVYDKVVPGRASWWITPVQDIKLISQRGYSGFLSGLAVDDREIFAQLYVGGPGPVRIGVLPVNSNGPTKLSREMITSACNGGSFSISYTMALYSRYLYQQCETPTAVFIYDKHRSGRVRPVFSLTGPFPDILSLALGP